MWDEENNAMNESSPLELKYYLVHQKQMKYYIQLNVDIYNNSSINALGLYQYCHKLFSPLTDMFCLFRKWS